MKDIREFIESGVIEAYVLGMASSEEIKAVEDYAAEYPAVNDSIEAFSASLEQNTLTHAVAPDPIIKPLLMATLDFMNRMENGENPSFPPDLTENSTVADYTEWLKRADFVLPPYFTDVHARIISYTPQATMAVVWIKELAPQEVHHDEYERFLIIEGTCTITVGEVNHPLSAGDFFEVPLYQNHLVKVTSSIPCKVILQRVAA
jgi:mannose-6-phosphate isomerase-like protein (cupin superfamily)